MIPKGFIEVVEVYSKPADQKVGTLVPGEWEYPTRVVTIPIKSIAKIASKDTYEDADCVWYPGSVTCIFLDKGYPMLVANPIKDLYKQLETQTL